MSDRPSSTLPSPQPEDLAVSRERLGDYARVRELKPRPKDIASLPGVTATPLEDGKVHYRVPRQSLRAMDEMMRPAERLEAEHTARDRAARPREVLVAPDGERVSVESRFARGIANRNGVRGSTRQFFLGGLSGQWLQCGHRASFAGPNGECCLCEWENQ